jgi:hypothetical protein
MNAKREQTVDAPKRGPVHSRPFAVEMTFCG